MKPSIFLIFAPVKTWISGLFSTRSSSPARCLLRVEAFEGVVELPVVAAQLVSFSTMIGREALIRQRQGRRDAGETAADDQGRMVDAELARFQGLQEFRLGDGHADEVLRLFRRRLGLVHVHPGILVPDVGHLEEVAVQARLFAVLLEEPFVGSGRAGGDDDPARVLFLDDLAHLDGRILGAGEEVVRGDRRHWAGSWHTRRRPGRRRRRRY